MREVRAEALSADVFAPFGDVLEAPGEVGRTYFDDALKNLRAEARASLSIARTGSPVALPLDATLMERHRFSSQSFIPLMPCRWLIVVAPQTRDGGRPDEANARAFLAGPGQGITYQADVWHHPLSPLEAGSLFAIVMWRTGGAGDEEFVDLETGLRITAS